MASISYNDFHKKHLIIIFWIAGIAMGAWQTWEGRNHMSADGISYIDMADAYMRGDWDMAINAYWSPLYSWLLGLSLLVLKPSPYNEFTVVHIVNFVIFLFSMGCFHFFISQLIKFHRSPPGGEMQNQGITFPEWAWIALGYGLFLHPSLNMISVWDESPDMLVAASIFLISGIILCIRNGMTSYLTYAFLGVALGFGYLSKAAMFPMAFIFLSLSTFAMGNFRKAFARTILALIIFLIVATPFIAALSKSKGRITFGDSGKYSYWFHVNGYNDFHWDGDPPESGNPLHPPRKIHDKPAIYEFGTPFAASYPLWYDPSYWNDGLKIHFDLKAQLDAIKRSIKGYYPMFYPTYSFLICSIIILFSMSQRRWLILSDLAKQFNLMIPAIAGLCMYALVSIDDRYVAPFITLLFLGILSGIRLADSESSRRLLRYVAIIVVVIIMTVTIRDVFSLRFHPSHVHWQVAESLKQMGIVPGDKVASIGNSHAHYWARLARVHIVSEIPYSEVPYKKDVNNFWNEDTLSKSKIFDAFGSTGAKIIVTNSIPANITLPAWERIPNTDYYVYKISK